MTERNLQAEPRRSRKARWVAIVAWGLALLPVLAGPAMREACAQEKQSGAKKPGSSGRTATLVKLETAVGEDTVTNQTFVGTLRPLKRSIIGSAVDGRVDRVFVEEGQRVGPQADGDEAIEEGDFLGEPLVQIKTRTLEIEIEAAEVQKRLLEQILNELELSLPREIALAKAAQQQAEAQYDYVSSQLERYRSLASGGGISQREREEVKSQFQIAMQAKTAADEELGRLETTRGLRLSIAQSRLDAQLAELKRLDDLKQKYTLRTPFAGAVTRKLVEQGDWVTRGAPVIEVVQLDTMELRVNVPQEYLAAIQQSLNSATDDQPLVAEVTVNEVPREFDGQVLRIIPEADPRSRSIPVVIRIANPPTRDGYLLTSGLLATATMPVGGTQPAVMVSKDALVLGERQIKVFVAAEPAAEETSVREVIVELGVADGDRIQVFGEISAGDQVVVLGNERLTDGQPVRVAR